jgi:mono/diheme cytochrome c family protein
MRITRGFAAGAALLTFGLAVTHSLSAQPPVPAPADTSVPPPGPALDLINQNCSGCHSTATVFSQRKSADDWAATVQLMVDRGAELKPDEQEAVTAYLSKNFADSPAASPAAATPPAAAPAP